MTDTYTKAAVAWERIQEVMQTKRDIEDLPGAVPASPFQGSIEFDHVAFSYGSRVAGAADVSFRIAAGRDGWRWWSDRFPENRRSPACGALLRPTARGGEDRWIRHPAAPAIDAAQQIGFRAAGNVVVPRDA